MAQPTDRTFTVYHVHLVCISPRSCRSSASYSRRNPSSLCVSLSPGGARHSPAHIHFKARLWACGAMAGLVLCREVRNARGDGKVVGTRPRGPTPPRALWIRGARFDFQLLSSFFTRFPQVAIIDIALRSLEWALVREPLRRYEPPTEGQHDFVERPLSIPNVLLDAFDLICNKRGIGWSWSRKPFPPPSTRSTSIASILTRILVKFTVWDLCLYTANHLRPSTNDPAGDTIFDPALGILPRWASATLFTLCFGMLVYTSVDVYYHIASLVGRLVFRQPAWQWPPPSNRPWMSTSIADFWRFRWHGFFRHVFIVFGARPGKALFGRHGALLGAFGVSAVIHDLGLWGLGRGTEFRTVGGFFILMGVGVILERAFEGMTGRGVGGFWGWVWTMVWTLGWCTLTVDAWVRRGMAATDPPPNWLRPGKLLIETIILPLWRYFDIYGHHLYK